MNEDEHDELAEISQKPAHDQAPFEHIRLAEYFLDRALNEHGDLARRFTGYSIAHSNLAIAKRS